MSHSVPLVSVIIPVYNAEKYISDTISSVLQQTWSNIEIILVNDGSVDDTEKLIAGFLNDSRVKYIKQDNAGCSAAKNRGLAEAKGDFIQYLDADDLLSNDKIAEQVRAIDSDRFKVAVCRTRIFKVDVQDATEEIDTSFLYTNDDPFAFLLNLYGLNGSGGMIQPNAFLISRELSDAAGAYDTSLSPSPDEDGEYFCRVMLRSSGIVFTGNGINYYRKAGNNSASLSRQISHKHAAGLLRSLELKAGHLLSKEDSPRVRRLAAKQYADFIYLFDALFPDLSGKAQGHIANLDIKEIPKAGGYKFQLLANLIGVNNALTVKRKLSRWKHQ